MPIEPYVPLPLICELDDEEPGIFSGADVDVVGSLVGVVPTFGVMCV